MSEPETPQPAATELQAQTASISFTLTITRATGEVETIDMVATPSPPEN